MPQPPPDRQLATAEAETLTKASLPERRAPRIVLIVPLVVLGFLPFILLKFGTEPISDPDTLWHIVAGRNLWSSWQFAGPDQLAEFTRLPFVYHQWLPELAMAGANAVAGLAGVAWLFNAMLLGFVIALYVLCRSQAGVLAALFATVVGWIGAGGSLSPRPQVFGFILLVISLAAWLRTERDNRIRWWLIPLTGLWACVHGSWVYAVGLAVLFGFGMLLDRRVGRAFMLRVGGLVTALAAVATLTPVGPRLLLAPAAIYQISPYIQEWRPTSITDLDAAATMLMGLVVVVAWIRRRERVSWTRMFLWAAAMLSALMYARTIAIGAILLAPLVADTVQRWLPSRVVPRAWEVRTLGLAALVSLILAAVLVPATARIPANVPSSFDRTLATMPEGTVVWNVDALGGWLLYSHPNVEPTMDTRAEVYGPDYLRDYVGAISASPGWDKTVAATGARYAIVSAKGALADGLQRQLGWSAIIAQEPYVLLEAPSR